MKINSFMFTAWSEKVSCNQRALVTSPNHNQTFKGHIVSLISTAVAIWYHNIVAIISYSFFSYLPITSASDLLASFLIKSLAQMLETWSSKLKGLRKASLR